MNRSPIRAISRQQSARRTAWAAFRRDVLERDGYRCVVSGHAVSATWAEVHHRKLRKHGGPDSHPNTITLCGYCHGEAHRNPTWAKSVGLIVPPWMAPEEWPVLLGVDRAGWVPPMLWQLPDELGVWTLCAPHPDQDWQPAPWDLIA